MTPGEHLPRQLQIRLAGQRSPTLVLADVLAYFLADADTPIQNWTEFPVRKLMVWLTDDVCPVIEDYSQRPTFREQATWPLRVLRAGAATTERRCIEAVEEALVRCAKAFLGVAGPKHSLTEATSPVWSQTQTAEVSGAGVRISRLAATQDTGHLERSQVDSMARRFWTDLVCPEDYFEPCGGWLEKRNSKQGQAGEFVVSLNPELHSVGDFVTRCLFRRLEVLHEVLNQFRIRHLQDGGGKQGAQAWSELETNIQSLRAACQTGRSAQLRDSCVILVQVYAAFHPAPDCRWLELSESALSRGIVTLRHRLTHSRNAEMPERIATALGDLRPLYEGETPQSAAVEEAIASGGLVVIEDPPKVFWQGAAIKTKWKRHPACWKLLVALASKGGSVDACDLYDKTVAESTLPVTINRLRRYLPASLHKRIVPGAGAGSYRLELERRRISIFARY